MTEIKNYNEKTTLFLEYLSWLIYPISRDYCFDALDSLGFLARDASTVFRRLMNDKVIVAVEHPYYIHDYNYCIDVQYLLYHIKKVTPKQEVAFKKLSSRHTKYALSNELYATWRTQLLRFFRGKPLKAISICFEEDSFRQPSAIPSRLMDITRRIFVDEATRPLITTLPRAVVMLLYKEYFSAWVSSVRSIDLNVVDSTFLKAEMLTDDDLCEIQESLAYFTYILPGRVDEIPYSALTAKSPLGLCAVAFACQYKGDVEGALKMYRKALRLQGTPVFNTPLYTYGYMVALNQSKEPVSLKKLDTFYKKKVLEKDYHYWYAQLILLYYRQESTDVLVKNIDGNMHLLPPCLAFFCELVIFHFQMRSGSNDNTQKMLDLVRDNPQFKLLQAEFTSEIVDGVHPLLPAFNKPKEWEEKLALLSRRLGYESDQITSGAPVSSEARSRIIYYVTPRLAILPYLQKSKNGESWTKGRAIALKTFRESIPEMESIDHAISKYVESYSYGWGSGVQYSLQGERAFSCLVGHPHVYMFDNPGVKVDIYKEEPLLIINKVKSGYKASTNITRVPESGTIIVERETDQLYRVVELNNRQKEIIGMFLKFPLFPAESETQLKNLLKFLSRDLTIHSDLIEESGSLEKARANVTPYVLLQPFENGIKAEVFVKPFTTSPPYCKPGIGSISIIANIEGRRLQAIRNLNKEQEAFNPVSAVFQQVARDDNVTDTVECPQLEQSLELLEALRQLGDSVIMEWPEGCRLKLAGSRALTLFGVSLKTKNAWFEMSGSLQVDEHLVLTMEELLSLYKNARGRFVPLDDNTYLALTQQMKKQLDVLDAIASYDKGKVVIPRMAVDMVSSFEKQGVSVSLDTSAKKMIQQVKKAGTLTVTVPKGLKATLRDYQMDGFTWLSRLDAWGAGACLADDMGLGKTVEAIAMMLSKAEEGAMLVVCPASVLLNWQAEISRFAPALNPILIHQNDGNRQELIDKATSFDVIITTYGLLHIESEAFASKEWRMVVLDEAHSIKNKETKMSKAAMSLQGKFKVILTGTPIQNHLSEIWNLFQFINPGLLGSFSSFTDRFLKPIELHNDKKRQKLLKRLMMPFILRRTKDDVLDELPPKTEQTLLVQLSQEERALYESIRRNAEFQLEQKELTAMQTLTEITRLRQAACHPALIDSKLLITSSKTQEFLKLVLELANNNHRALVFSQFTSHLALVRKELDALQIAYLYLDGATQVKERTRLVQQFQRGDQPLFLISLKAGGLGLNLTAADYVIHLDPWWNPAVEDQASDRAHRIGQTHPVTVYRIIAQDTIEEKIMALHVTKKSLADSLLEGSDMAHKLTREDLLALLRER